MPFAVPPNFKLSQPTILLTGATGLIGSAWLPLLKARYPDRQLAVLARKEPDMARFQGICAFRGDLTQPHLGLPPHMPTVNSPRACGSSSIVPPTSAFPSHSTNPATNFPRRLEIGISRARLCLNCQPPQPRRPFREYLRRGNQAQHQISFGFHIEVISRLSDHALLLQ